MFATFSPSVAREDAPRENRAKRERIPGSDVARLHADRAAGRRDVGVLGARLEPHDRVPARHARQLQRRAAALPTVDRPAALPDGNVQVDDVGVRRAEEREPVAEPDGVRAARLEPVEADAARAARDAERPRALPVAGAVAPAVHDERRLREELAALHRHLPRRGGRRVRGDRHALEHVEDAVPLEREDRAHGRRRGDLGRGRRRQRERDGRDR